MNNKDGYNCRVCGFQNSEKPWGDDNKSPNFSYCPCCGVEFGYQDSTQKGINVYRNKWISKSLEWEKADLKPSNWDFSAQISNISDEYYGSDYLG